MKFLANLVADAGNTSLTDVMSTLSYDEMVLLGTLYFVLLGTLVVLLLVTAVSFWRIFAKAGIPGWKSIIPIYNLYVMYKHFWKVSAFNRYILWVVLYNVLDVVLQLVSMNEDVYFVVYTVYVLVSLIALINFMILSYRLAKSFDRGFLFSLGLTFLSPFFHWILGLGDCDYVGDAYDYYY